MGASRLRVKGSKIKLKWNSFARFVPFFCTFYIEETSVTVFGMFVNASDEVLTPEVVKIPGMESRA